MALRLKIVLWIIILIYITALGAIASLRHYNFQTQTWDTGIFVQTMWNTAHGRIMENSIEEIKNHFAVHMSPFLFLLAPGFVLFPSAYYLLTIQTMALGLGAWPLYLLANKILNSKTALAVTAAYLLYPALHWVNWFDFHPIAFLAPFFIAAFYFYEEKKYWWMALFLMLAASTQEDAVLVVLFFGLYLLFFRKEKKLSVWIILLSAVYFLISIKIVMPYLGGGLLRLDRYNLGVFTNPLLFLKTALTGQKLIYLFWLFLPVAFLPFFAWQELILLIPGLAQNLLTNYAPQFSGAYQYDSVLIGGIFIATIYGASKLSKLSKLSELSLTRLTSLTRLISYLLLTAAIIAFLIRSPISPLNFPTELFHKNPRAEAFREITKIIPENASVAAHTNLVPHLATRERIYMLGYEPFMTDYVVADGADYFGFGTPEIFQNHIQRYADTGKYEVKIIDERYYILTKR